ncbi:MAG: hypothetical protein IT436_09865 [Phycisphaerales bacterium]|nr:hypothetical protein [Phycisphaerales bacterium]
MPRIAPARPTLRLVNDADPSPGALLPEGDERIVRRTRAVEAENRSAADLSSDDARVIFAAEVAQQLQGGLVALLTPERRQRLMHRAGGLGLRPFDANLIIAIVQDRARGGEFELDASADVRLGMIRPAGGAPPPRRAPVWMMVLSAVALAGAIFTVLVLWLRA